jgi:hypothetical protein
MVLGLSPDEGAGRAVLLPVGLAYHSPRLNGTYPSTLLPFVFRISVGMTTWCGNDIGVRQPAPFRVFSSE